MKNLLYILLILPLFFISSCEEETIYGCTSDWADNFLESATDDDGSCFLAGCNYPSACNYNELSTIDNGTCEYPEEGYDCQGNTSLLVLGAPLHGGLIFYIDATGEHGLVAAFEDVIGNSFIDWGDDGFPIYQNNIEPFVVFEDMLAGFEWGCSGDNVSGANGTSIGTGLQNTLAIVNQGCITENGGKTAAQATLDYSYSDYADWYLPSRDELEQMFNVIGNGGNYGNIGGFHHHETFESTNCHYNYYWSSTQSDLIFFAVDGPYEYSYVGGFTYAQNMTPSYRHYPTYRVRPIRSF